MNKAAAQFRMMIHQVLRKFIFRFFSDEQRKSIKHAVETISRVPMRLSGVQNHIASLKSEINRTKSYLFALDGKMNSVLYGMPKLGQYRATVPTQPLFSVLELTGEIHTKDLYSLCWEESAATIEDFANVVNNPAISLIFGRINWTSEKITVVNYNRADKAVEEQSDLKNISTDPLTAILFLPPGKFEFIWVRNRLNHLSAIEQPIFLINCVGALSPNGTLCLEVPNLEAAHCLNDFYWKDPRNLRPFSLQCFLDLLIRSGLHEQRRDHLDNSGIPMVRIFLRRSK